MIYRFVPTESRVTEWVTDRPAPYMLCIPAERERERDAPVSVSTLTDDPGRHWTSAKLSWNVYTLSINNVTRFALQFSQWPTHTFTPVFANYLIDRISVYNDSCVIRRAVFTVNTDTAKTSLSLWLFLLRSMIIQLHVYTLYLMYDFRGLPYWRTLCS